MLRVFRILLLLGGIIGTAYFSYFAFVEGNTFAQRDKRTLAEQQEKIKTLKQELQKSGNSKEANANLEKKYEDALNNEQLYLKSAAENEDFYKRQTLFAAGSGVILVVGLLIFILSFTWRDKKAETVSP